MTVIATDGKSWLHILLLYLTVMTSARRQSSHAPGATGSSCHVTQTGTGCRYALSLRPLNSGGAACHGNVTSRAIMTSSADSDIIVDKLDDAVVKVTRMLKQCLRQLRQVKADVRKVREDLLLFVHSFFNRVVTYRPGIRSLL